ncbi:MAG: hypothetical protein ACPG6V_10630 [Flavobacteriales bacterium]
MRTFLLSIFLFIFLFSCTKENQNPGFPNEPVNLSIYPGSGAYYDLGVTGGWMYLGGGVNGILVYRLNETSFVAYDRACPYKPKDACERIEIENGNSFIAVDPCCESKYLITTGDVTEGPSEYNLKYYNTSFNGSLLQIWN